MSRPATMLCEQCGKDITIEGSQICPICDPDIQALITRAKPRSTPQLCEGCFKEHLAIHQE